jgi:hypothetical protein
MQPKEILNMKTQLKGIALLRFGILLMLFSIVDRWIPMIDVPSLPAWPSGLACGAAGLALAFKKEKD